MGISRKSWPVILLFALLAGLSVFFYAPTITGFPSHIHVWTQSDRYALALGFLDNGFDFAHPQVPNLEPRFPPLRPGPQAEQGITGVDFPFHEYLVAGLMKGFGSRAPGIFRLYVLIFSLIGAWSLFRLTRMLTGSATKGLAAAAFIFTAPILTYYQAGFIPSAPSFAATLIGYFFYFRYREKAAPADFRWALGFLALAALARSPFNIFLFAVLLQQGLDWWRNRRLPRAELIAFACAYAAILGWLGYKNHLDKTYGSQFIGHLLPAGSAGEFFQTARLVWQKWGLEVFSAWHWLLLALGLGAALLTLIRRPLTMLQKAVLLQSGIALAGAAVFQVLMIGAYVDHEYYFIDSFYPGFALLFVFGLSCLPWAAQKTRWVLTAILSGLLILGAWASQQVQARKYGPRQYDFYEITRQNFTGADSLAQALNIPREAKILVIDAAAANLPLLLLDRRGYTVLSTRREEIARAMRLPWDFVAIQDVSIPSEVVFPYPEILGEVERLGGNGRVSVFRRRSAAGRATLDELMGLQRPALGDFGLDFEQAGALPDWGQVEAIKSDPDAPGNHFGFLLPGQEFSPTLTVTLPPSVYAALWEGRFRAVGGPATVKITATVAGPAGQLYYRDRRLTLAPEAGWQHYQVLFPQLPQAGTVFKCYVWNPDGAGLEFDDWRMRFYPLGY